MPFSFTCAPAIFPSPPLASSVTLYAFVAVAVKVLFVFVAVKSSVFHTGST